MDILLVIGLQRDEAITMCCSSGETGVASQATCPVASLTIVGVPASRHVESTVQILRLYNPES
jgi:hypothetical protein